MEHSRHHEEPVEVRRRRHLREHVLVVVHRHQRVQRRVRPPVVSDHLPAVVAEAGQVGVRRVEDAPDGVHPVRIHIEVELLELPAGVVALERHVAHEGDAEGLEQRRPARRVHEPAAPAAGSRGRRAQGIAELRAERLSREIRLAAADDAAVDLRQGRPLPLGQAIDAVLRAAARIVGPRVEGALPGIVDEAVLQPVQMIAGRVDRVAHAGDLLQTDRVLPQRLRKPRAADLRVREVEHRRPGDDAVEVVREALGRHQPLASTGGTAQPVVVLRGPAVVLDDELLDRHRSQMNGAVGVVHLAVAVVVREGRQRIAGRVVSGIGRSGDVALVAQRIAASPDRLLSRVAAAAAHDEPPVPVRRQARAETDIGADQPIDPAVLGCGARVHDLGIHDADVEVRPRQEIGASVRPRRRRRAADAADTRRRDDDHQADSRRHVPPIIDHRRGLSGEEPGLRRGETRDAPQVSPRRRPLTRGSGIRPGATAAALPLPARRPGGRTGCPPSSSCLHGRRTRTAGSRSAASASRPSSRSPTCRDRSR